MLELRPNCECCDRDLPGDSGDALICTFECTFCRDCATTRLGGQCPNGGQFLVRSQGTGDDQLSQSVFDLLVDGTGIPVVQADHRVHLPFCGDSPMPLTVLTVLVQLG